MPTTTPKKDRPLNAKEQRVAEALRGFDRPVSAYDLIAVLKDEGLTAPPTVYRALNRLIEKGLAHRLESLNAFIACAHDHPEDTCANPGHGADAIFAVCSVCGHVSEFTAPKVSGELRRWAKAENFALTGMTLELRGTCAKCQAA